MTVTTDTTFPRSWSWDEDGDLLRGRYVEISEAPTREGVKPVLIVEVEGGERRTCWLFHEALRNKLAEEVARRPTGDLIPGEPIVIERLPWRESEGGRRYRAYRVAFPERPKRSAREILLGTPAPEVGAEQVDDDAEDIPF